MRFGAKLCGSAHYSALFHYTMVYWHASYLRDFMHDTRCSPSIIAAATKTHHRREVLETRYVCICIQFNCAQTTLVEWAPVYKSIVLLFDRASNIIFF